MRQTSAAVSLPARGSYPSEKADPAGGDSDVRSGGVPLEWWCPHCASRALVRARSRPRMEYSCTAVSSIPVSFTLSVASAGIIRPASTIVEALSTLSGLSSNARKSTETRLRAVEVNLARARYERLGGNYTRELYLLARYVSRYDNAIR